MSAPTFSACIAFSKSEVLILPALGSTRSWMKSSYLAIFRRSSDPVERTWTLHRIRMRSTLRRHIRDILCIIKVCSIY
jgi:hypothetical protein